MKVLGLIPARGGSKGVPRKNILPIQGKPLIAYSIETAQNCTSLTDVVVSTDDAEIAEAAKAYNCQTIMRPPALAEDTSNVVDAALQVLQELEEQGKIYDFMVLLQPTSPLRMAADIEQAIELLKGSKDIDAVISVVEVGDQHPARMYGIEGGELQSFLPGQETKRRQDLQRLFIRNGCIYAIRTEALISQRTFMPTKKAPLVMPSRWAVNVDTPMDVIILRELMKQWKEA